MTFWILNYELNKEAIKSHEKEEQVLILNAFMNSDKDYKILSKHMDSYSSCFFLWEY